MILSMPRPRARKSRATKRKLWLPATKTEVGFAELQPRAEGLRPPPARLLGSRRPHFLQHDHLFGSAATPVLCEFEDSTPKIGVRTSDSPSLAALDKSARNRISTFVAASGRMRSKPPDICVDAISMSGAPASLPWTPFCTPSSAKMSDRIAPSQSTAQFTPALRHMFSPGAKFAFTDSGATRKRTAE